MDELSKGETFMADDNTNDAQAHQQPPEPNPGLECLNALVGQWSMEGTVPFDPPIAVWGRAAFEWLTGGYFLVQRWDVTHPDFPMASRSSVRTPRPRHIASTTSTPAASSVCMR
jgi:hypothetical protein